LKNFVIIVAGGSGVRMVADIPKQFLNINGRPILLHTISRIHEFDPLLELILVLPESYLNYWQTIISENHFSLPHRITKGGETRFQSVKNGLELANEDGLIAVHDGVRPLVSRETFHRVFAKAEREGNAIPVVKVTESLRKVTEENSFRVDRESLRVVQTPQCFRSDIIHRAYQQDYDPVFTDDASLVENLGIKINLVDGNPENIKITQAFDLKFAEAFLK
jgi:2-C-methyl-D-erythritol 4-phosphate cytidylyltransferase